MNEVIPVADVIFLGNERRYVREAMEARELSWHGRFVSAFEQKFAAFVGVPYALACSNGTAALHLALLAAGIGPGMRVIVPALTYVASANAVRYCGAEPVFVDVDPRTWCLDLNKVDQALTQDPLITAVLCVQLYGYWPDMDGLKHLCHRHDVTLIEDAAEALGGTYKDLDAGAHGRTAAFSFYANKTVTCGEGGMVTTSDPRLYDQMRQWRAHGAGDPRHPYYHAVLGYNYRMTNLQAAVGLAQLETILYRLQQHESVCYQYRRNLAMEVPGLVPNARPSWWMQPVLLPRGVSREAVVAYLRTAGIETRPTFLPLPSLPMYGALSGDALRHQFPVADLIGQQGLCLPTHAGLSFNDVARVIAEVKNALEAV